MQKLTYPQLKETVLTETLPNGLTVTFVVKPDYHKTFATLTTPFGGHTTRVVDAQTATEIIVPAGTAHFLEHKLFDQEAGDAFTRFGELGADANAFTTPYQTTYLFSTITNLAAATCHLLDFVQTPYFTEATIAKEQGIIGQEIAMYQDNANTQLYNGLLAALYPESSLGRDIIGTPASLATITPELLYKLHRLFYQPSQLTLRIVGNFDPIALRATIRANQATKMLPTMTCQAYTDLPKATGPAITERQFAVQRPKLAFGLRAVSRHLPTDQRERAKFAQTADLVTDLLFGEHTDWYQMLYSRQIIDTDFSVMTDISCYHAFTAIFAETTHSEELMAALSERHLEYQTVLSEEQPQFECLRRAAIGEGLQQLNSLENIALDGDEVLFNVNLFDKVILLQEITWDDIVQTAHALFANNSLQKVALIPG